MIIDIQDSQVVITEVGNSKIYTLVPNNPPVPVPVKQKYPVGKGILIWKLARIANGNMAVMAQQAKDAGFSWISIKVIERGVPYFRNTPFIKQAIQELRAVGISVRGWGYLYPDGNQTLHAQKTAEYIKELGLDGYELDVEGEWKVPTFPQRRFLANEYSQELRKQLPDLGIGMCSFRYPKLHGEIPWKEFLDICDYHAPQVYWIQSRTATAPKYQLERSLNELKALKDIPYIPIGSATWSDDRTWEPTVDQLNNFYQTVLDNKFQGHGWYEWVPAYTKQDWWNTIRNHR